MINPDLNQDLAVKPTPVLTGGYNRLILPKMVNNGQYWSKDYLFVFLIFQVNSLHICLYVCGDWCKKGYRDVSGAEYKIIMQAVTGELNIPCNMRASTINSVLNRYYKHKDKYSVTTGSPKTML